MKKYIVTLAIALFFLTSCSDDNNIEEGFDSQSPSPHIGFWQATSIDIVTVDENVQVTSACEISRTPVDAVQLMAWAVSYFESIEIKHNGNNNLIQLDPCVETYNSEIAFLIAKDAENWNVFFNYRRIGNPDYSVQLIESTEQSLEVIVRVYSHGDAFAELNHAVLTLQKI